MIIQLHEDQLGQVRHGKDLLQHLPITNSVKQGCVLAPMLFTILFSMMLQQVTEDLDDTDGLYIRFRLDRSMFDNQSSRQQTSQGKQCIRQTIQTCLEQQQPQRRHECQSLHSCCLLERCHQRCLRIILNIYWSDFVANSTALELAKVTSIETMVLKIQLRWTGHIARMKKPLPTQDRALLGTDHWLS